MKLFFPIFYSFIQTIFFIYSHAKICFQISFHGRYEKRGRSGGRGDGSSNDSELGRGTGVSVREDMHSSGESLPT